MAFSLVGQIGNVGKSLFFLLFFSFLFFYLRRVSFGRARRDFVERDQIRIAGFCREISCMGF
jgi:hypothetical protein